MNSKHKTAIRNCSAASGSKLHIERFGEARIMEKIHKVPGLEGMTLEIARTLLTRPRR